MTHWAAHGFAEPLQKESGSLGACGSFPFVDADEVGALAFANVFLVPGSRVTSRVTVFVGNSFSL